jgi:hypothetical protein
MCIVLAVCTALCSVIYSYIITLPILSINMDTVIYQDIQLLLYLQISSPNTRDFQGVIKVCHMNCKWLECSIREVLKAQ